MAEVITMPFLSPTMETGTIAAWLKKVGETVEEGEVIAEIETDKATMEVKSDVAGVLLHRGAEDGESVPVEKLLAIIGSAGEKIDHLLTGSAPAPAAVAASNNGAAASAPAPVVAEAPPAAVENHNTSRVFASPLAKVMAESAGIAIQTVQGSGDNGRIVKRDVEVALSTKSAPAAPVPVAAPKAAPVAASNALANESHEDLPLTNVRKTIARRLSESLFTAPHFYLTMEINMDKAMALRKQLLEVSPVKISFNDIVVKAVAASLRQHPVINSSWMTDFIRRNHHINIGVAVAVGEGLFVPVIRNADMKSLGQISTDVRELAGKAKEGKLGLAEMQGSTFTISNLGMFDIEEFTAIINPPDSCILAVGSILQKPIVKDGELAVGNLMRLTLSCDHRVVDGATGAQFLQTLKSILEDPIRLLV
jgi:pyruvate dehydrogenase E2 component (dihydrolipoamide acetyltransferase)